MVADETRRTAQSLIHANPLSLPAVATPAQINPIMLDELFVDR